MANRTVFGLAAAMGALSFLASHYDQFFFTLHFIETLIYFVIMLLMFYRLEEWAYAIGIASPICWILLAVGGGMLGTGSLQQFGQALMGQTVESPIGAVTGVMFVVAIALAAASGHAFKKSVMGTKNAGMILVIGSAVTVIFYGVLVLSVILMSVPTGG